MLGVLAGDVCGGEVDQTQVVVRSARNKPQAPWTRPSPNAAALATTLSMYSANDG